MCAVKWKELVKVCEGDGCTLTRQQGDHLIMTKPGMARPIVIPKKRDLKELIVMNAAKALGLNRDEMLERLGDKHPTPAPKSPQPRKGARRKSRS